MLIQQSVNVTGTVNPLVIPTERMSPQHGETCQKRIRTDCPTPSFLHFFHTSTKSLRGTLVNVKDPLPTPKQQNVVYHIPCSDCPNAYCPIHVLKNTKAPSDDRMKILYSPNIARRTTPHLIGTERPSSENGTGNIRAILSRHGTLPPHVSINT